MTNKTNINNFGSFSAVIAIYADTSGEVRYDRYTYDRAMMLTEDRLIDELNASVDNKMRKTVRAAYAVARAAKAVNSWRVACAVAA